MKSCKSCGAPLSGDEEECGFCGLPVKQKNKVNKVEDKNRIQGDFSEYHETICNELDKKESKRVQPISIWKIIIPFVAFFILSLIMMFCLIAFL